MNFSIRLENLLEEENLTQKQLALDLHIANSTVNGYVKNNREPDFSMLIRLARYFNVSTDYLLGLSPEKKPAPSNLNPNQAKLLYFFDSLILDRQDMLMEQAYFYYRLQKKH